MTVLTWPIAAFDSVEYEHTARRIKLHVSQVLGKAVRQREVWEKNEIWPRKGKGSYLESRMKSVVDKG
jgi:hypothetical protein